MLELPPFLRSFARMDELMALRAKLNGKPEQV
jgi:hypothetical protein